jgi:putative hemolysin
MVVRWRVDADRDAYVIVAHHPIIFVDNLTTVSSEMKGHGCFDLGFK